MKNDDFNDYAQVSFRHGWIRREYELFNIWCFHVVNATIRVSGMPSTAYLDFTPTVQDIKKGDQPFPYCGHCSFADT